MTEEETQLGFDSVVTLLIGAWPFVNWGEHNLTKIMKQRKPLFPHVEKVKSLFESQIWKGSFKHNPTCAELFNEVSW